MKDARPICPKCGCPAREVRMIAKVTCDLNRDGTFGKVKQAGTPVGQMNYVCGGGHKWSKEQ